MITAKQPQELQQPATISDMRPGESGHATFTDLNVGKDGDCYLTADARLREKGGLSTVEVRRA